MDHYSDYNGFNYKSIFWGNHQRDYEDNADKQAIKRTVSPATWFLDLGGGFGRLIPIYREKMENIILLDSSIELLREAATEYQEFPNINFICAEAARLPFHDQAIDAALMFRMLHCIDEQTLPLVFKELERVVKTTVYLEFANKRNLFRVLRYLTGNREVAIFDSRPEQVNNSFFNFTYPYLRNLLAKHTSFKVERLTRLSFFRNRWFKKFIPLPILKPLESFLQRFWPWNTTPSIFLKLTKKSQLLHPGSKSAAPSTFADLIACPICHHDLQINADPLLCPHCHKSFIREGKILNFRD